MTDAESRVHDALDEIERSRITRDPEYLECYALRQQYRHRLAELRERGLPRETLAEVIAVLGDQLLDYETRRGDHLRKGGWIPTPSRKRFWLEDPRPEEVCKYDLAWGLSRVPRFNGLSTAGVPYSVAQHLVLASRLVPGKHALAALLHDAAEVYCHDIISPLKRLIADAYKPIEERVLTAVMARFGVLYDEEAAATVSVVDRRLLSTEVRDLTSHGVIVGEEVQPPYSEFRIRPWDQERSYHEWLDRLEQLTGS